MVNGRPVKLSSDGQLAAEDLGALPPNREALGAGRARAGPPAPLAGGGLKAKRPSLHGGAGAWEKREPSPPRPHWTTHSFFHGACGTGWMVLIKLIWKTDGKFFPEVNPSVIFQKEATWLTLAVCVWQLIVHVLGSVCRELLKTLGDRTVMLFIAGNKVLQMPLPAPLSRNL